MIVRTIPGLELVSGDNQRSGSWHDAAKRAARAKGLARLVLAGGKRPRFPVVVTLVRIWPRPLDTAGLASALKGVEDGVAEWLKVDDGRAERAKQVLWIKHNETGGVREHACRIEIEELASVEELFTAAEAHPVLTKMLKASGWKR